MEENDIDDKSDYIYRRYVLEERNNAIVIKSFDHDISRLFLESSC